MNYAIPPNESYMNEKDYSEEDINFWFEEFKLYLIKKHKIILEGKRVINNEYFKYPTEMKRKFLAGHYIFKMNSKNEITKLIPKGRWPVGAFCRSIDWREE